jgi:N-acetylneuraminic acid mutarotase
MRSFVLATLICTSGFLSAQDFWIPRDSVKGPGKSVASAFVANGQGYIVAGLTSGGFVRSMYSYDVNQDDWDDEQSMGGLNGGGLSRGSACSFSIGGKGYICLGQGDNTDYLNDVWEYDPALDVWSQKANYAGSARRAAVAFVINDIAYVGTGQDVTGLRKDFYKYDPATNLWGAIADFAGTPRKYAVGFAIGNQGYVGTGNDGVMKNDFWQYQVFQNTWVQKASFPGTAREGATGWGSFPDGFIATGEDINNAYCNDVWQYNYFTNAWTQRTSLPAAGRKHAVSFMIGNITYLGTGYNGDLLDDFYAYDGITGIADANDVHEKIRLYPNPCVRNFSINAADPQISTVRILDIEGRDVTSDFGINKSGNGFEITVLNAASGMYSACMMSADGSSLGANSFVVSTE